MNKTGPTINRGNSKQDYRTPDDFREAILNRFGYMMFDLAADGKNYFSEGGPRYYDETSNSLVQDWHKIPQGILELDEAWLWLNPPFDKIGPWAKKCADEMKLGARILFLVPASVGADWFRDYVQPFAFTLALSPRLTFDGCKDPYPKDLILAVYAYGLKGFDTWRWKE